MTDYPYQDGDVTVLAPELFVSRDGTVISWRGENFYAAPADGPAPDPASWSCKIGRVARRLLPDGADAPMRRAVKQAYAEVAGEEAEFVFSGWGARLTESEQAVIEAREPTS